MHHVRPSGKGGLSESENLITLCATCHVGLEPHEDFSLFDHVPEFQRFLDTDNDLKELKDGIARYREISLEAYAASKDKCSNAGNKRGLTRKKRIEAAE